MDINIYRNMIYLQKKTQPLMESTSKIRPCKRIKSPKSTISNIESNSASSGPILGSPFKAAGKSSLHSVPKYLRRVQENILNPHNPCIADSSHCGTKKEILT